MEREMKFLKDGTKMYESDLKAILTLDNIFKYASEDELRAIVSSIIGRLNTTRRHDGSIMNVYRINLTDKDLDKFVKELRDVK
tara:strand:+ start:555 stop:803 length:249 start_codon:yes stop_codon:yes gene_type:complete